MNREVVFRGKRLEESVNGKAGEWVEGSLITDGTQAWIVGEMIEANEEYCILERWDIVDPATVGQFTGLLDKNRKRIFEGDMLRVKTKFANSDFHCFWNNEKATFYLFGEFSRNWGSLARLFEFTKERGQKIEIIGTIHDEQPEGGSPC